MMSLPDPDALYTLSTYDRLGGVLKELSEAGIVSEYGAWTATNLPVSSMIYKLFRPMMWSIKKINLKFKNIYYHLYHHKN